MSVDVDINMVQFGTAKSASTKPGIIRYKNFKIDPLRKKFLNFDWGAHGPVDMVVNMNKNRIRVFPSGVSDSGHVLIEGIIEPAKKPVKGELKVAWTYGQGREARQSMAIFFRIPDAPPPYVKGSGPKKSTAESPSKSKKQKKR